MNLHHVGVVVRSVKESGKLYANLLGMRALGSPVQDDIQRVIVQFYECEGDSTTIELIEPLGDDSPVAVFLSKGGGMAHLCYEVDDLERSLNEAHKNRAIQISGPFPAAAFDQRRIAFVFYKGIGVIEFVERKAG